MKIPSFIRPEFFDIFGVGVFLLISVISWRTIFLGVDFPAWMITFLFVIGIAGFFIDGTVVYTTYIKGRNRASENGRSVIK